MPSVAPLALSSRAFAQAAEEAAALEEAAQAEAEAQALAQAESDAAEAEEEEHKATRGAAHPNSSSDGQAYSNLTSETESDAEVIHRDLVGDDSSRTSKPVESDKTGFGKLGGLRRMQKKPSELQPINGISSDSAATPAASSSAARTMSARFIRGYHAVGAAAAGAGVMAMMPGRIWLTFKTKMYLHLLTFFLFYCAYLIMMLTPTDHFESGAILLAEEYAVFDAGYLAVVVHCAGGGFADLWPITRVARFVTSLHLVIVFVLLVVP